MQDVLQHIGGCRIVHVLSLDRMENRCKVKWLTPKWPFIFVQSTSGAHLFGSAQVHPILPHNDKQTVSWKNWRLYFACHNDKDGRRRNIAINLSFYVRMGGLFMGEKVSPPFKIHAENLLPCFFHHIACTLR